MFFEDIFYPDNPKRRAQIQQYQADLRIVLTTYKSTWNTLVNHINPIFAAIPDEKYNKIRLQTLDYNISDTEVKTCIEQINSVAENTKSLVAKLFSDIGLPPLPDGKDLQAQGDLARSLNFYITQIPTMIIE